MKARNIIPAALIAAVMMTPASAEDRAAKIIEQKVLEAGWASSCPGAHASVTRGGEAIGLLKIKNRFDQKFWDEYNELMERSMRLFLSKKVDPCDIARKWAATPPGNPFLYFDTEGKAK